MRRNLVTVIAKLVAGNISNAIAKKNSSSDSLALLCCWCILNILMNINNRYQYNII